MEEQLSCGKFKEEKKVYDAEDIQMILGIGRSKTYAFLREIYQRKEPFKVIRVGNLYKIPKKSFDKWLENMDF